MTLGPLTETPTTCDYYLSSVGISLLTEILNTSLNYHVDFCVPQTVLV